MSEEELKAIEALKGCILFWQEEYVKNTIKEDESSILAEIAINQTLLNLIEKQQKEIENSVSKDKIREKQILREFELQQEYKEFKEDTEWNRYNELLEELYMK